MRWRRRPWLRPSAALLALTLAGCASAVVSGGRVNLRRVDRIYSDVQELRQLNFKSDVPLVLMDQGQADLVMEREFADHHGEAELQRAAEVGALTGLYPAGINLKSQTMRVLSSQVVAFYDPQDQKMILVKGKTQPSLWSRIMGFFFKRKDPRSDMLVAHELTHALQDQYFGVHAKLDRITDNDDRALALKSVIEGDATLVGYGYTSGIVNAETIDTLLVHLGDMPKIFDVQSPDTPVALRDSLIFQYTDGTRFVAEVYQRGGWNAVNALCGKPPLSTREIIDPTLYFIHSVPLAITVRGWAPALRGWREVAENTYGELLLRSILTRGMGSQSGTVLARAWRGDRMAVLQSGVGATTVIWIVALSDDTNAAAFAQAYQGTLDRVSVGGVPAAHHVERRGTAVLAIIGAGAAQSAKLAPAVWRRSVIGVALPGT
jgi:hypothetical protein